MEKQLANRIQLDRWRQSLVRFLRKDDGPTAVEYAVMLALIIVVCVTAVTTLGNNANGTFGSVYASGSGTSGVTPVGGTSAGYTAVPTGEVWGLSLAGGTTVTYNSTTGVETTNWAPGYHLPPQVNNIGAGKLGSDRGQMWTRTQ